MSKYLCLISLGCTKNLVDSEVMLGRLGEYKLTDEPSEANVIIVNTCGFIASAKQESVQKILQVAQAKQKDSILVVSGCLSERYSSELKEEIPEIDIITGVGDYDKIDLMIESLGKANFSTPKSLDSTHFSSTSSVTSPITSTLNPLHNHAKKPSFLIDREERVITGSKIHAYIKLSEGCNQQCSFCAIPSIKGKLHSRTIASCVREVESLIKKGYRDFSFVAQDSSSYMRDFGKKDALIELIDSIEQIDGIRSARILYLYPSTTTINLIERIAESSVFQPYFDMPLQHISDSMLGLMRRGADKARHIELLEAMRKVPNSFIRTTLLLGHPGESERDFDELCEFMESFVFDRVNLFAFSSEEGTRAYNLPQQVDSKITHKRIKSLDKILQSQQKRLLKDSVSSEIVGIIEGVSKESDLLFSARDVRWDREIDGEILINDNLSNLPLEAGYYRIKIDKFDNGYLIGKALERL